MFQLTRERTQCYRGEALRGDSAVRSCLPERRSPRESRRASARPPSETPSLQGVARSAASSRSDANLPGVASVAHLVIASVLALVTWRALQQAWVDQLVDPAVVVAVRWGIPVASAAASALAVVAGWAARRARRLLVADAASWLGQVVVLFALALVPIDR